MADPVSFAIDIPDDVIADALRAPRREFLLKPRQVADIVGIDRQTVYRWIKAGRIKAVRPIGAGPGRAIRIPVTEVNALLAERGLEPLDD